MPVVAFFLLWLARTPFWEARPPGQWTPDELHAMLTQSPWAQGVGPAPVVGVILATARPIDEAEAELVRRHLGGGTVATTADPDYTDYIARHRDQQFSLAIPYSDLSRLGNAEDERRLEEETVMTIGRRRVKMTGHFPPTPGDPVLRLIFPRVVKPDDKSVGFELFLPGITNPARLVEFRVRDLLYRGKLEM